MINDTLRRLIRDSKYDNDEIEKYLVDNDIVKIDDEIQPTVESYIQLINAGTFDFADFICESIYCNPDVVDPVLQEYIAQGNTIDVSKVDKDARVYMYNYLVENNRQDLLTYGMSQELDLKLLAEGVKPNGLLDFYVWDDYHNLDVGILDDGVLINHVYDHMYALAQEWSLKEFLTWAVISTKSLSIFDRALKENKRQEFRTLAYNLFSEEYLDHAVLPILMATEFEEDWAVYELIGLRDTVNYFATYINLNSVIRYFSTAEEFIQLELKADDHEDIYQRDNVTAAANYYHWRTAIHDQLIAEEYETNRFFTIMPILKNFTQVNNRAKNTGDVIIKDLLTCHLKPGEEELFVNLIRSLSDSKINQIFEEDEYFECGKFKDLRFSQQLDIVNTDKRFFGYYAAEY